MDIERANNLFISAPRPLLGTAQADDLAQSLLDAGMGLRTLIHMDDPQHRVVRAIGADWFRPKATRALKVRVDEAGRSTSTRRWKRLSATSSRWSGKNDPLYVIMSLLGLPNSTFRGTPSLTQELFGGDLQRVPAAHYPGSNK